MTVFGQLVIGAPGAGKSTYCEGMRQYLSALGRDVAVVNLDPANDEPPYEAAVDLRDLVELSTVMSEFGLGPNGGLVYCLEYLEANLDWLEQKLAALGPTTYVVFDFPGQLELFTHCGSIQAIASRLTRGGCDCRLAAVNLIDAHHCSDPSNFISASLLSLTMMVRLEMPHVNVLSKVDLIERFGELPFNLEFFTDLQDMQRLLPYLDASPDAAPDDADGDDADGDGADDDGDVDGAAAAAAEPVDPAHAAFLERRRRLHGAMCELLDDFSLVSFETLDIQSAESVGRVLSRIDKANGYVFQGSNRRGNSGAGASSSSSSRRSYQEQQQEQQQQQASNQASSLFSAVSSDTEMNAERTLFVQEKYSRRSGESEATAEQNGTAAKSGAAPAAGAGAPT
jgi:GTPase SAR1 family protein